MYSNCLFITEWVMRLNRYELPVAGGHNLTHLRKRQYLREPQNPLPVLFREAIYRGVFDIDRIVH